MLTSGVFMIAKGGIQFIRQVELRVMAALRPGNSFQHGLVSQVVFTTQELKAAIDDFGGPARSKGVSSRIIWRTSASRSERVIDRYRFSASSLSMRRSPGKVVYYGDAVEAFTAGAGRRT